VLFSTILLDSEEHASGVLSTLSKNAAKGGALNMVVRKICLLVGAKADRLRAVTVPPAPPIVEEINNNNANAEHGQAGNANANQHLGPWAPIVPHNNLVAQAIANAQAFHQQFLQLHPQHAHLAPLAPQATPPPPVQQVAPIPALPVLFDDDDDDEGADVEEDPASLLTLESSLAVLRAVRCIHFLTFHLPKDTILQPDSLAVMGNLALLRKMSISCKLEFPQLWQLLQSMPLLSDLEVFGLVSGNSDMQDNLDLTSTFHLTSLSLTNSALENPCLHALLHSNRDTLSHLKLAGFSSISRGGLRKALQIVGPKLRRLALHRITFTPSPLEELIMGGLLDNLPRLCPLLEELQIATDRVCSEDRFLQTVLPSLFLTTLELDFRLPVIQASHLITMIGNLPAGRMETLCLGQSLAHLATPQVLRACQEIDITVLSTLS
jgi:hypothetical protein